MPRIGNHVYQFDEVRYSGTSRGVFIQIRGIGARNHICRYRLGHAYDPHALDVNWYLNNFNRFYQQLGEAVANYLENHPQQWNVHINWPNAIHANIHGIGYHAIREDLF